MDEVKMTVRLPVDVAEYLKDQAKRNYTTRNAEVIRSVRERMGVAETMRAEVGSAPVTSPGG
ncbi:DNA-binding protein [Sinorhizobium meliloti]|nr:DNA-binding protein [Sinorhizobium meliloti]RVH28538.1 DNA-binding protein [Sinorhizobium meliloti]